MPFRNFIVNNFLWKATALLLAMGAWYGFQVREGKGLGLPSPARGLTTRELVAHPLTVTKPAADTREFRVTPQEVDITISGDLDVLKKLDGRDIRAMVDLTDVGEGTNTVPIRVFVPPQGGIKLERLMPETVQVELLKQ